MFLSNRYRPSSIQIILVSICSIHLISNTAYAATLRADGKSNDLSTKSETNVCTSPLCKAEASYFLSLMNEAVDPCDDFHQFVCGKFISNPDFKIPEGSESLNSFNDVQEKIYNRLLKEFEEINENDSDSIRKLKIYFGNCKKSVGQESVDDLMEIINNTGGMPLLSGDKWNENNFNYTDTIAALRTYGLFPGFPAEIVIGPDIKNNAKQIMTLFYPETRIEPDFFVPDRTKLTEYYDSMVNKMVKLGVDPQLAKKEMKDCLDFEVELYNVTSPMEFMMNATATYNPMTIKELSQMLPNIPWLYYFKRIFSLNSINMDENEVIIVFDPEALRKVEKLLERTPKKVIANYLMWQLISASFEYLPDEYTGEKSGDKTSMCVDLTAKHLPQPADAIYAQKFGSPEVKKEATELVVNIKNRLKKVFLENNWMDEKTEAAALEKAEEMRFFIGYPDELLDNKKIDDYYQDLKIEPGSYLRSIFNMSSFNLNRKEKSLKEPSSNNDWTSLSPQTVINAQYNLDKNSLEIPTAILQSPFFNTESPKYLNYGNLGNTIGHAMTNGFDNGGREYDKTGQLRNWWEPSTKAKYDEKAECFLSQYNNYTVKEVGLQIDGARTLDENIADAGGLVLAYRAYIDWINRNNVVEPQLPGLNYTPKQMFWISSAISYCKKQTRDDLQNEVITDNHSPYEARIKIPRWNSREFAEDFQCAPDSPMNPAKKCTLW